MPKSIIPAAMLAALAAAAVPAQADPVTLGLIRNLSGRTFRLEAEGSGIRFLVKDGKTHEDPRGVEVPPRTVLTVEANRDSLGAGHGFRLTCAAGAGETLEVRMEPVWKPSIRSWGLRLVAWDHRPGGAGTPALGGVSRRMEGSVLVLQEKGQPGWKPAADGGVETKAAGAGAGAGAAPVRPAPAAATETKAGGAGETKAAGAGAPAQAAPAGAVESKAAGTAFKVIYAGHPGAEERLGRQCAQARKVVAEWREKAPDQPVHLILGAQAWQWQRFGSSHWIYLDCFGRTGPAAPEFCADFNVLGQLGKAAAALAGQVDHIYVDVQVLKFSHWKKAHLDLFRAMLRPGGTFHLPLEQCAFAYSTLPVYQPEDSSSTAELLAYASLDGPADELPRSYEVPANFGDLPKAFQAKAEAACVEQLIKPALLNMLFDSFDEVVEETGEPEFLRRHPHRRSHTEPFFACRAEAKDR